MGHTSLSCARARSRRFGLQGLQLLVMSGLSLSLLVGCSSGDDKKSAGGQEPASSATVDHVEMDGFLLIMGGGELKLLDPETGKVSADGLALSNDPNPSNHFSVSPNGR